MSTGGYDDIKGVIVESGGFGCTSTVSCCGDHIDAHLGSSHKLQVFVSLER